MVDAGTTILMQGATSAQLFTVLDGMGLRYHTLPDGNRQVLNFIFPGDLLGLQSSFMSEMYHTIQATTDMRLCVFDRSDFMDFFSRHPQRAYDITWLCSVEEHFLGDALASVGQRSAREAVAWSLLRIYQRCVALEMSDGHAVPFPFRQQDLADALGLSLVHTNKTVVKLRNEGVARLAEGKLYVPDVDVLAEIAGDPDSSFKPRPLL